MVKTLIEMWFSLRKYGRLKDVMQHLLRAEHELLSATIVVFSSLKDAAAPYSKDDPLASLLCEVFQFMERTMTVLLPNAATGSNPETVRETQRRALLAIREVLLEERAAVVPDAIETKHRTRVVDAILSVIDRELLLLGEDEQEEEAILEDEETQAVLLGSEEAAEAAH